MYLPTEGTFLKKKWSVKDLFDDVYVIFFSDFFL